MTLAMHYVSVQYGTLTIILKQQEHVRTYTTVSHVIAATMDVSTYIYMDGLLCLIARTMGMGTTGTIHAQMTADMKLFTLINPVTLLKLLYRVSLSPILIQMAVEVALDVM